MSKRSRDGGGTSHAVLPVLGSPVAPAAAEALLARLSCASADDAAGDASTELSADSYLLAVRAQSAAMPGLLLAARGAAASSAAARGSAGAGGVADSSYVGGSGAAATTPHAPPLAASGDPAWEQRVAADFERLQRRMAEWAEAASQRPSMLPPPPGMPPHAGDLAAWRKCCVGVGWGIAAGSGGNAGGESASARPRSLMYAPAPSGEEEAAQRAASRRRLRCVQLEEEEEKEDAGEGRGTLGSEGSSGDDAAELAGSARPLPPLLSVLLRQDQLAVGGALRLLVPALLGRAGAASARTLRPAEAAWLYGYLARLERPLLAEVTSTLRQLFVACRQQRAALLLRQGALEGGSSPRRQQRRGDALVALNVLIAVTGRVFAQRLPGED